MLAWFGELLRFLLRAISHQRQPRSLALAVALGVMLGLLPKLNLIAALVLLVVFVLRVNILVCLATTLAFSWLGILMDPWFTPLGAAVLKFGPLQGMWAALYQLPWVPWTQFNSTAVMGNLLIGALQFYPTYRFARYAFEQRQRANEQESPPLAVDSLGTAAPGTWRIG